MGKNTGRNYRIGAVCDRTQMWNPWIARWIKRVIKNGQFLNVKSDGKPFKGVAREVDRRRSIRNLQQQIRKMRAKNIMKEIFMYFGRIPKRPANLFPLFLRKF